MSAEVAEAVVSAASVIVAGFIILGRWLTRVTTRLNDVAERVAHLEGERDT